jgi:hypothetical protein
MIFRVGEQGNFGNGEAFNVKWRSVVIVRPTAHPRRACLPLALLLALPLALLLALPLAAAQLIKAPRVPSTVSRTRVWSPLSLISESR